jgi:glycosyltransferase involved in cell wall biosynthesis
VTSLQGYNQQGDNEPQWPAALVVIIPAYQPGRGLVDIVRELAGSGPTAIVVVDDGSGPRYRALFDELLQWENVRVLRHAINLGKGAALKTGINCALVEYPGLIGVVTADADGQHDPADIRSVARRFVQSPEALVLGTRVFLSGKAGNIPLRSRLGNTVTRQVMRFAVGHRLSDTQTGLRAIPRGLLEPLLQVTAQGYEFELEMLIAAKHLGILVIQQPIRTIYETGNPTSHFQPLRDSMRIYFVLLRYTMLSLLAAGLDNLLFFSFLRASGGVAGSLLAARCLELCFNYLAVRRAVFFSKEPHRTVLPRYLLLAAANICVSWSIVSFVTSRFPIGIMPTKVLTESFLFIANFALQRDFVFARRSPQEVAVIAEPVNNPELRLDPSAVAAALNTDADISA